MTALRRTVPVDLSAAFTRFRSIDPERLHFAAHSHHYWPDVARDAHIRAWDDAARLADDKWVKVIETDTSEYIKSGGSVYCLKMFFY